MSFSNNTLFKTGQIQQNQNQSNAQEIEIPQPPSDTVSCLKFSGSMSQVTYLMAGSWDKTVKIWEITNQGVAQFRAEKVLQAPILDCCWSQDSTKAFIACTDKCAYMWDIASNNVNQIAVHDAPIKTIHYIQAPTYSCVMTGSWDKKLKFWNMTSDQPIKVMELADKIYCADVHYPMAVVGTADKKISVYNLENQPTEFKQYPSKLNCQLRCIKIFLDVNTKTPAGFIVGSIEGRVGIQSIVNNDPKESFTFKCHRIIAPTSNVHDIFAVNDLLVHPIHQTIVTMGSDGKIAYWNKVLRTKIKGIDPKEQQPVTAGSIDSKGNILAYAMGYDWSKGHEYNDVNKKPKIFIRECNSDLMATNK